MKQPSSYDIEVIREKNLDKWTGFRLA